jgi:uncharacterized protein YuzE
MPAAAQAKFNYDEETDILYVSFAPGEKATAAVELNDNILLRFNREEARAIGITFMDFSVLMQPTPLGSRHFPLSRLIDLEPAWQELVLTLLKQPPVSDILKLSSYTPAGTDIVPIVAIESPLTTM